MPTLVVGMRQAARRRPHGQASLAMAPATPGARHLGLSAKETIENNRRHDVAELPQLWVSFPGGHQIRYSPQTPRRIPGNRAWGVR
jgi:hypothetical protein